MSEQEKGPNHRYHYIHGIGFMHPGAGAEGLAQLGVELWDAYKARREIGMLDKMYALDPDAPSRPRTIFQRMRRKGV